LILQSLLLATSQTKSIKIEIEGGGTWNKWAPPVIYLEKVLFPLLGEKTQIKILKDGFYPKGGARVDIITKPLNLKPIEITDKGDILGINCFSIASKNLEKARVAERQAEKAKEIIKQKLDRKLKIETRYVDSLSAGSGILIYIKTKNSVIGADSLGERGKPAENVAKDAVKNLLHEYFSGEVDRHAADMLLPYMSLAGSGKIKTGQITHHIKTNISVIEKFLPVKFTVENKVISCRKV
jgi:RNA 3'-phosphate cyclase